MKMFLLSLMLVGLAAATEPEIKVEVFSDFQCPYCAQFAKPVRELQTKGIEGVRTKVDFKNFPLSFHADSQLAHQAAFAAGEQGKFWEMHDLLFANQAALKRDSLLDYARKLGLDMDRFVKDLDGSESKKRIEADKAEGQKLGVNGTPTFFVDGKEYSGTKSFDQLKELVAGEQLRKRAIAEVPDSLMSKGPANSPVTIEFFADLQSPVSRPAGAVLDQLMARYPSKVRVQFRNFPLAFHPQASLAHDAAMAAARQGHFWEVETYLLDHQDSLREQDLIAYAGKLGIDQTQFAETIQQHRYAPRVEADVMDGFKRGIRGSPVIFVNGRRIDGVPSLEMLTEYVGAELGKK
ncbi:MAG: DsbA family protein [Bryobacteraceae bacterium]